MTALVKKYARFGGFRATSLISALLDADQAYRAKRKMARLDADRRKDLGLDA